MIMLGTLINTGAIIAGGVVGSFFQRGLKERVPGDPHERLWG